MFFSSVRDDAAVVLDGDDDLRQAEVGDVRLAVGGVAAEEDRAAVAAPGGDQREDAFVLEELRPLRGEARARRTASAAAAAGASGSAGATGPAARRARRIGFALSSASSWSV